MFLVTLQLCYCGQNNRTNLDDMHDLVCWPEPRFPAALHPYILVLVLVSSLYHTISADVAQFGTLASFARDGSSWHLSTAFAPSAYSKNRWFVIVTLSIFFITVCDARWSDML